MKIGKNVHAFIWNSATANNCNTYLIDGMTRILIDPGHARLFEHTREQMSQLGISVEDIELVICTHAHFDHMEAVEYFSQETALVSLHEDEWKSAQQSIRYRYGKKSDLREPDFFIQPGYLSVKGLEINVIHTPGHSPGSVCLYLAEEKLMFTGDLIFKAGIGRTDLPGGSGALLKESIIKISEFDVETVLPGHGDIVTGKQAVAANFDHIRHFWFNYL